MLANPAGDMDPYTEGRKVKSTSRLPTAAELVRSGVADIVVLPEAHCDSRTKSNAASFVAEKYKGSVELLAASIEATDGDDKVKANPSSGIVILVGELLASAMRGEPKYQYLAAGRILHVQFDFLEGPLHVIALYGVSGASTTIKQWLATGRTSRSNWTSYSAA